MTTQLAALPVYFVTARVSADRLVRTVPLPDAAALNVWNIETALLSALPVYEVGAAALSAQPVYVVGTGNPNPQPPPAGGTAMITEDNKTMLTEDGKTMVMES